MENNKDKFEDIDLEYGLDRWRDERQMHKDCTDYGDEENGN